LSAALAGAACAGGETGLATAVVALDAERCDEFCATMVGAALYRPGEPLPIGPERTVPCGEPIVFDHLPGGQKVLAEAWVLDADGRRRLQGRSADVTVVADDAVPVPVELVPVLVPEILDVSPDPLAPDATGTEVAISGTGFGDGSGRFQVTLDGVAVAPVEGAWTETEVRVRVPAGDGGTALRVVNCGVSSGPFPVRVLAAAPGTESLDPGGCPGGLSVRALAPLRGTPDVVVAAACGVSGYVQRLLTGSCSMSAVAVKELPGLPVALAAEDGGAAAWAAIEGGALVRAPLSAAAVLETGPALPGAAVPRALAFAGGSLWVLGEAGGATRLYSVRDATASAFDDVPSELTLAAIAAAGGKVLLAATDATGKGRLVAVDPATSEVRLFPLDACGQPLAVEGGDDGAWAAVACGGGLPAVSAIRLADAHVASVPLAPGQVPSSLAMDLAGSLAFAWDEAAGAMIAIGLDGGGVVGALAISPPAAGVRVVRAPSSDTLVLAGCHPGRLTLLSPFHAASPCATGGGP
jgi:hypothetical protein